MKKRFSDTICGVIISSELLAGYISFTCYAFLLDDQLIRPACLRAFRGD